MTIDDPHNKIATTDEQPTSEASTERAELLGTTALAARLRCPCGKRQDVSREDWQWNGVAVCSRCGRGILDDSLRVVSRREALAMVEERRPTGKELRALRHMEMSLRHFMLKYGEHPRWYWSPPTSRMADEAGRLLAELDDSRRDRGAPPVVAGESAFLDGGDGDEEDETGTAAGEEEWDEDEDEE